MMTRETDQRSSRSDAVDRLLEIAGPRPELGEEELAELKRAIRPVWRQKVHTYAWARRRRRAGWLIAAMIVLSVGGFTSGNA